MHTSSRDDFPPVSHYRDHHDILRKKGENEKALVTKEMGLGYLGKTFL